MRLIYFSAFVICLFAYTFFVLTNHEIGKQMFLQDGSESPLIAF
jgi:hypothetical protein